MLFPYLPFRISDAALLGRTDTVVGLGGDIGDGTNLEAGSGERADRGLTTGTRALDEHVDLAHAVVHGAAGGSLSSHLRGIRGGLARALESDLAGRGPRDHRTGRVSDRDDGVAERALDVSLPEGDVLLFLLAHLAGAGRATALGGHSVLLTVGASEGDRVTGG